MTKHCLLLLFFFLLQNQVSFACGCTTDGSFLEVSTGSKLIAVVEIQNYLTHEEMMGEDVPTSMSVRIKQVLKGKVLTDEIIIWGNNGFMCSPYLSIFEEGTTWVMSLKKSPMEAHQNAELHDYGISNCGENFLKVQQGSVSGLISGGNNYQSMSILTLKKKLDIINREESQIDNDKCLFIQQLRELGVDTIGVFENYQINNTIRSLNLKASFQMSIDDLFPAFYDYMQDANIYRQVFIYWQSDGKTRVKQIDNLFNYDGVTLQESSFFDHYFNYSEQLTQNPMQLSNKHSTKDSTAFAPQYLLQSIQFFIDGSVVLRDFDTRLFNKNYNPKYYKQPQNVLTHNWLKIIKSEAETMAIKNEKCHNLFKLYKRSRMVL